MNDALDRFESYRAKLEQCGQSHLLRFWPELGQPQRAQLLDDLDQIDFDRCEALIDTYVRNSPALDSPGPLEPPPIFPATPDEKHADLYRRARAAGESAVRAGRVAAFTVAGGQGTRLGFDGPKGAFEISPVRSACLFQLFAEFLRGVERKYGRRLRWYIMTSPSNHQQTLETFRRYNFFELPPDEVVFFPQRQIPAFSRDGKIAMVEKHRVALAPDGHGGSLRALVESGALDDMRRRGIGHISYFQVDNPLVRPLDPLFIGLHIVTGSEMSSKAVTKADDLECVGNFCLADDKLRVIEYTDFNKLPEARAKNPDGSRRFDAGSIAVHLLSRAFVERLTAPGSAVRLPWHRTEKKLPMLDARGRLVTPTAPNAVLLEKLVFDAIPLAQNRLVLYTQREEEFSPVKNADGVDSAVTARRDLVRRAARWLESCGCVVPRNESGEPDLPLEISPAFALDGEDLRERLTAPPRLKRGTRLLLE